MWRAVSTWAADAGHPLAALADRYFVGTGWAATPIPDVVAGRRPTTRTSASPRRQPVHRRRHGRLRHLLYSILLIATLSSLSFAVVLWGLSRISRCPAPTSTCRDSVLIALIYAATERDHASDRRSLVGLYFQRQAEATFRFSLARLLNTASRSLLAGEGSRKPRSKSSAPSSATTCSSFSGASGCWHSRRCTVRSRRSFPTSSPRRFTSPAPSSSEP
jgi:hypothetical protein